MPALGFSLFLVAVGAILAFAVNVPMRGLDVTAVGVILLVIGFLGMAMSMLFWTSWAPFARRDIREDYDGDVHIHTP